MKKLYRKFKTLLKAIIYPIYEARLERSLKGKPVPAHIGIIVDGNRRWSRQNPSEAGDISSARGHRAGANKIEDLLKWSEKSGVKVVTIWLLSSANLSREAAEVSALLEIIESTIQDLARIGKWEIRPVGSMELLPEHLQKSLSQAAKSTLGKGKLVVNVAIGYGGRDEIVDAVRSYLTDSTHSGLSGAELGKRFTANELSKYLYTAGLPDPDLLIRTSGEQRLGGFLLWQSADSEFYFCDAYWPDFRHLDYLRAIRSYGQRQRRFGR
jgi:short-chain Z-isoprenyl diphosphate synthase